MRATAETPTLDRIAANPELAQRLPRAVAFKLLLQAAAVTVACSVSLADEPSSAEVLVDVREAARAIGISPITLAHRARKEPYCRFLVPTGSRTLRFSTRAIREWQEQTREELPK